MKWTVLISFLAFAKWAGAQGLPDQKKSNSYSVIYTGRTLGNFRDPEMQTDGSSGSPNLPGPIAAARFKATLDAVAKGGLGTTITVASGDNFAPFLLARKIWSNGELADKEGGPPFSQRPEFDTYVHGHATIEEDNVASFFIGMKFDALVPGKEDFYFGPEYLRELAYLMRTQPCESAPGLRTCGPRMLGSNLALQTRRLDPNQPGGVALPPDPPRPSGTAGHGANDPVIALPKVALPWMRAVRIKSAVSVQPPAPGISSGQMLADSTRFELPAYGAFQDWLRTFPVPTQTHFRTGAPPEPGEYSVSFNVLAACIVSVGPTKLPPSSQPPCSEDAWKLRPALDNKIASDLEFVLPEDGPLLEPNGNYAACFIARTAWGCSPFTVQIPYFEYPDDAAAISRLKPWVLKKADDGLPVAIFGVVGAGLLQSVGRLNYTWTGAKLRHEVWGPDDSYETVVQAAQPGETLKQILRYCLQDASCRGAHKVLLAQMSEQDAYGIVGQLQALKGLPELGGVELIVAAADASRASGDRDVTRYRDDASRDFNQPIVLVPGEHTPSINPYDLQVRLQQAVVTPQIDSKRIVSNRIFLGTRFRANPLPPQTGNPPSLHDRFLAHPELIEGTGFSTAHTDEEISASLERITLKSMREVCHSDAAILQHHDTFFSNTGPFLKERVDNTWAQAMIDAILWKGDLIECIRVTGDVINNLLQQSQQFQDQEDNGIDTGFAKGWALATIGLDQSQPDPARRIVGGAYLNPKQEYSIAITDFLANGDTGYTAVQNAQPLPADTWSGTTFWVLADAVKHEIFPDVAYGPYSAPEILDNTIQVPPDKKIQPGIGQWITSLSSDREKSLPAQRSSDPGIQRETENRGVWSIDLYRADASFALFLHNGSESDLGQRFPGVTAVDLSSPNTESNAFDYQLRIERSGPRWWDFYIESDLNYGHKANRTPQNVYQRSETADYWDHEIGLAPNLWPGHRNPSTFKALLPFAIRSQLWPPITQVTPGPDTPMAKAIATQAPVNYTLSFRPGLRFDHVVAKPDNLANAVGAASPNKGQPTAIQTGQQWVSYIEAGFEMGQLFNGPSAYKFMGTPKAAGTPAVNTECFVANPDFLNCILGTPADTPSYSSYTASALGGRNHRQSGLYMDFRLDVPLPRLPQIEFLVENRGDFYVFGAPADTIVDARLYNDLKTSLVFPIPGLRKLSLAPTFEWIVFRNKLIDNTYFGVNAFVSLSYSFDWRQGLEWKKVLGFNNPTPPLSSLPTR